VPRIADVILDCVIYLYPSVDAARKGVGAGGSGFLVSVPSNIEDKAFIYAVTNRHVIKKGGALVLRLNSKNGSTYILESEIQHWHFHREGDDIAVAQLSRSPSKEIDFGAMPIIASATIEILTAFDIVIGDDVFMVGRFVNHEGKQKNIPAVQFGHISIMPLEPISNEGYLQESYAVDIRSSGGFSGSPVFVRIVNHEPGRKPFTISPSGIEIGFIIFLLGINWGHLNSYSPVEKRTIESREDSDKSTDLVVKENTSMAAVVPVWKLIELLQVEALKLLRETQTEGNDRLVIDLARAEKIEDIKGNIFDRNDFSEAP
jgi:hypothetical protein